MARILIKRTPQEWEILCKMTSKVGLPSTVRRAISTFVADIQKNPEKITEIECRRANKEFLLPEDQYHELQKLSVRIKIPVCTIVDELIISPLLLSK